MKMYMTLYWGNDVTLLFDSWTTKSWPSYAVALLICFLISVFYQFLEAPRLHVKFVPPSPNQSLLSVNTPLIARKLGHNWRIELGLAMLFGVNSAIGYLIMLAIMSFNRGVLLVVELGLTVRYYIFRTRDIGDGDDYLAPSKSNTCACS